MNRFQTWVQALGVPFLTLFTSISTLVCCALPALLVSLGLGAALASTLNRFPQLTWISEHKPLVFVGSAFLLVVGGVWLYWARNLPCPADKKLADACIRGRKISYWIYGFSVIIWIIGFTFAFLLA
ncbi:hypothetical protein EBR11_07175 [bacterium]|jgi:hypothetical protein|nr:hypothetical protein [bacterium]